MYVALSPVFSLFFPSFLPAYLPSCPFSHLQLSSWYAKPVYPPTCVCSFYLLSVQQQMGPCGCIVSSSPVSLSPLPLLPAYPLIKLYILPFNYLHGSLVSLHSQLFALPFFPFTLLLRSQPTLPAVLVPVIYKACNTHRLKVPTKCVNGILAVLFPTHSLAGSICIHCVMQLKSSNDVYEVGDTWAPWSGGEREGEMTKESGDDFKEQKPREVRQQGKGISEGYVWRTWGKVKIYGKPAT